MLARSTIVKNIIANNEQTHLSSIVKNVWSDEMVCLVFVDQTGLPETAGHHQVPRADCQVQCRQERDDQSTGKHTQP